MPRRERCPKVKTIRTTLCNVQILMLGAEAFVNPLAGVTLFGRQRFVFGKIGLDKGNKGSDLCRDGRSAFVGAGRQVFRSRTQRERLICRRFTV